MLILFKPIFFKDLKKIPSDVRLEIKKISTKVFPATNNLRDLKRYDIKPTTGFKNYYRLRLGDYRIGFKIENKSIIFMRVKHRKEIYRYFP